MRTFLTYSDARRSGTAWRQATGTAWRPVNVLFSRIIFLGCEFFLAEKMNSDGIVFGGKRMGHSFYLRMGLLFCFVELRIEKKMNLLV
jgi:hypothetical protein